MPRRRPLELAVSPRARESRDLIAVHGQDPAPAGMDQAF